MLDVIIIMTINVVVVVVYLYSIHVQFVKMYDNSCVVQYFHPFEAEGYREVKLSGAFFKFCFFYFLSEFSNHL